MAPPNPYRQGLDQRCFIEAEAGYGPIPTAIPGADAAIRVLGAGTMAPGDPKRPREDTRNTRSFKEYYIDKTPPGTWAVQTYILPNGETTAPDVDELLQASLGAVQNDNEYRLAEKITKSVRFSQYMGMESWVGLGLIVDDFLLDAPDRRAAMFNFGGRLAQVIYTGSGQIVSGANGTDQLVVGAGQADRVEVGSFLTLFDDTDSTEVDHQVSAVDVGTDTLTVTPNLTKEYDAADSFYPAQQLAMTTGGDPIPSSEHSGTFDGSATDFELISLQMRLRNNHGIRDGARGEAHASGFWQGDDRECRLQFTVYQKEPLTALMAKGRRADGIPFLATLGSVPGKTATLTVPLWVPDMTPPPGAEKGDQIVTYQGRAIASPSGANDEFSLDVG